MLKYVVCGVLFFPALVGLLYRASSQAARMRSDRLSLSLEFYARLITASLALFACALYGAVASVALRAVGYGGLSQWTTARGFKLVMWWLCGVSFEVVEGEEHLSSPGNKGWKAPGEARVLLGNHQS